MTLDSGLRRNDAPGIMLCPDIFEHSLLPSVCRFGLATNVPGATDVVAGDAGSVPYPQAALGLVLAFREAMRHAYSPGQILVRRGFEEKQTIPILAVQPH